MSEIYVLDFHGQKYGIKKEDIREISDADRIHSLSFSLNRENIYFASYSGRFIYLFDIGLFLSSVAVNKNAGSFSIMITRDENFNAFVVESVNKPELTDVKLMNIPDFLSNEYYESFGIQGTALIPILNSDGIFEHVIDNGYGVKPFELNLTEPEEGTNDNAANPVETGYDLFIAADHMFAFPSVISKSKQSKHTDAVKLFDFKKPFVGVSAYDGKIILLADMNLVFGKAILPENPEFVIVEKNGITTGLYVEKYLSRITADRSGIYDLPNLVKKEWLKQIVAYEKNFYPLIDPFIMLSKINENMDENKFIENYSLDSGFMDKFGETDQVIVEIEVGGLSFGLPKEEAGEVLGDLNIFDIPGMPFIVSGLTFHDDKISPVIDLLFFLTGEKHSGENVRFLTVKNGNFDAILVIDNKPVDRTLPVSSQKILPVRQKHRFVYGCYIESEKTNSSVKLILDIFTIACHAKADERNFFTSIMNELHDEELREQQWKNSVEKTEELKPMNFESRTVEDYDFRKRDILNEFYKPETNGVIEDNIEMEYRSSEDYDFTAEEKIDGVNKMKTDDVDKSIDKYKIDPDEMNDIIRDKNEQYDDGHDSDDIGSDKADMVSKKNEATGKFDFDERINDNDVPVESESHTDEETVVSDNIESDTNVNDELKKVEDIDIVVDDENVSISNDGAEKEQGRIPIDNGVSKNKEEENAGTINDDDEKFYEQPDVGEDVLHEDDKIFGPVSPDDASDTMYDEKSDEALPDDIEKPDDDMESSSYEINSENMIVEKYKSSFLSRNKLKFLLLLLIPLLIFILVFFLSRQEKPVEKTVMENGIKNNSSTDNVNKTESEIVEKLETENNNEKSGNIGTTENETKETYNPSFVKFDNILFIPDSAELQPGELSKLDRIAGKISSYENKKYKLEITGHTALFGTKEGRMRLSGMRAENVYDYLKSKITIDEKNVTLKSFGAEELIGDSNTIEGNIRNRRVEILLEFF